MTPICKDCGERPAPNPIYQGRCAQCYHQRYAYSAGKRCPDCGTAITNRATRCLPCANKANGSGKVERVCAECGTRYVTKPSIRLYFCSQACALAERSRRLSQGGRASPAFTGEPSLERGYVTLTVGPKQRRRREHILVAERILGRPLGRGEVVHHINKDTIDNRPENLIVCTTAEHNKLHAQKPPSGLGIWLGSNEGGELVHD